MFTKKMVDDLIHGLTNIFADDMLMIILYGSVARKEETLESDVDIAIIIKNKMDEQTREKFILWSADLDLKFDRVFSIIDIEKIMLDTNVLVSALLFPENRMNAMMDCIFTEHELVLSS